MMLRLELSLASYKLNLLLFTMLVSEVGQFHTEVEK
jgi:hypothetical protein